MQDTRFLPTPRRRSFDIEPLSGAKVQEVVAKLYATPKDIVERAKAAIKP